MWQFLLAQANEAGQAAANPGAVNAVRPWWQVLLDNGLPLAILFIFLTAIVSLFVNQRRKDKCLKLMHDYHVSVTNLVGRVVWGDLIVFSRGMEIVFDSPYRTRRGLYKSSALFHEPQVKEVHAICRPINALSRRERKARARQIRRSFRPNIVRRGLRGLRNLLNTLKDAFSKALSAIIGQLMKTTAKGTGIAQQESGVSQIGTTLLGAAGNAYEPILERRIGKPVVLQLACKMGEETELIDLPGYLVDYTADYIAVFNVDHEPIGSHTLKVSGSQEGPGYRIEMGKGKFKLTCTGPEVLIVKTITTAKRQASLEAAVPFGCSVELNMDGCAEVELVFERTRRIDIFAPRSVANVYFGGEYAHKVTDKERAAGIAPEEIVEENSDDPVEGEDVKATAPQPEDPVKAVEEQV